MPHHRPCKPVQQPVRLAPSAVFPPDLTAELPGWHADAACLNADPDMFFPQKGEPSEPAKALCRRCPVAAECLAAAVDQEAADPNLAVGVWGGLSPNERKRLRRDESAA